MPRGIVLRPDDAGLDAIRSLWADLSAAGVPSIADHRKGELPPHLSLTVAGHLDVDELRDLVTQAELLPSPTVNLSCLGVFPGGVLHLVAVPDARLLAVQELAHQACVRAGSTKDLWRHYAPGGWTPHVTLGYGLTHAELATAAEVVLPRLTLALTGWTVEVEDGATGQAWPLN